LLNFASAFGTDESSATASFEPIYYLVFDPSIRSLKQTSDAGMDFQASSRWLGCAHFIDRRAHLVDIQRRSSLVALCGRQDRPPGLAANEQGIGGHLARGRSPSPPTRRRTISAWAIAKRTSSCHRPGSPASFLAHWCNRGATSRKVPGVNHLSYTQASARARLTFAFLGFYPEDGNYRSVHVGG
jgi:hypothetical protein